MTKPSNVEELRHDGVYAAISDPARRALLDRLRAGEAALSELCEGMPMSRQAVSKHLAVLESAGLVGVRSVGRQRIHSLNAAPLQRIDSWLSDYSALWDAALGRLVRHVIDHP